MLDFDKSSAEHAVETMALSAMNRKFARYWLSIWKDGAPPARQDIRPSQIKDLLPGIAIIELRPDGSAYCRLAGSAICMGLGVDPTGHDVVALSLPQFRAERLGRYRAVTDGAISRCVKRLATRFDETISVEDVQLPLSGGAAGCSQLIYHADWRPQTLDRSMPEILRNIGTAVEETVSIVRPAAVRAAS